MNIIHQDSTALISDVFRPAETDARDLESITKRVEITLALIGYTATQGPGVHGREVAPKFNVDPTTLSRVVRRVAGDSELIEAAETVPGMLK